MKWNWFSLIDSLANNNILNLEAVTKLPAVMCLTYLSYKQEMNNINK